MSFVAQNLYKELLKETANGSNRVIHEALQRQEVFVIPWIDETVSELGVEASIDFLNDLVAMNENYQGVMPVLADMVDAANHLRKNGVERDSMQFRKEIVDAGERDLFNTFDMRDGVPVERENLAYEPDNEAVQHPLYEPWQAAVARYEQAVKDDDKGRQASAEKQLNSLRIQIGNDPANKPAAPEKPEAAPELEEGYQGHDGSGLVNDDDPQRRLDALPDDGEYTDEQQSELDSIEAELDADENYTDEEY